MYFKLAYNLEVHIDVTQFHFSEQNVSKGNCFLARNMTYDRQLVNVLADHENALNEYNSIVDSIDDDLKAENIEGSALLKNRLNNTTPLLGEV